MDVANYTIKHFLLSSYFGNHWQLPDLLQPLRQWLNNLEIHDPQLAHRLCYLIPAQCPFARQIKLFGRTIIRIPPLCNLNPFYEELMALRFRAICYLAEECSEDISVYC